MQGTEVQAGPAADRGQVRVTDTQQRKSWLKKGLDFLGSLRLSTAYIVILVLAVISCYFSSMCFKRKRKEPMCFR